MVRRAVVFGVGFVGLAALACDAGQTSAGERDGSGGGLGAMTPTVGGSGPAQSGGRPAATGGVPTNSGGVQSGAGGSPSGAGGSPSAPSPVAPGGFYTSGNAIYRHDGTPHWFHGIDRPSLEWNAQGENLYESDYQAMAGWGANVVRLALNQAFWLRTGGYPETIDQQIAWAEGAGMDVILDLHWSDRGTSGNAAQQRMADQNSKTFWAEVAARYKGDGRVSFELYNEPHDVPWEVWQNGGPSGDGFTVVGMQELYDTVRAAGAHNLVVVGGLDFAYDLRGVPSHRVQGYNIAYATHPYDFPNKQPANWPADWGFLAATDPVIVTEFGVIGGSCDTGYYSSLIDYADSVGASWTAWAWYVKDCAFPSLIANWNGDPTAAGMVVREALLSY